MRLSMHDPAQKELCRDYIPYLNGREIKTAVSADEEAGTMEIYGAAGEKWREEFTEEETSHKRDPSIPYFAQSNFIVHGKVELRKK